MDDRSEGALVEMDHARHQTQKIINEPLQRQVTIDILPDDVLLVIFDHYLAKADEFLKFEEWHMLVHVCQKWRYIVFQSPLGLNLRILCSAGTHVREKLAVWPPLPIIIRHFGFSISKCGEDNIFTALGHNDRICEIYLPVPGSLIERVFAAMQKTFVALENLWLDAIDNIDRMAPVDSDSFLGGSAPHLRNLTLIRIPFLFPVLRKLTLSSPNLVDLKLDYIPYSGYISPEEMVTFLSALTGLKHIFVGFESLPQRPPQEGRHSPPTRSVLPALTKLTFIGPNVYLEDLVSRIDAPLLNRLHISFFYQFLIKSPQFAQFLSRTPKLKAYDVARVIFSDADASIVLPGGDYLGLRLGVSCKKLHWQLWPVAQICTLSFPQALVPMLEHLYILERVFWGRLGQGDLRNGHWFTFFHPFTSVKNLYLSQELAPLIMPALQELVGERVTEVLPNLQSIFLEDSEKSGFVSAEMQQFITARRLSGHPIAISSWIWQNKWPRTEVYDVDD